VSPRKTKFVVLASLVDYLERLSGKRKKLKIEEGGMTGPTTDQVTDYRPTNGAAK
jgi:hypothetical protein